MDNILIENKEMINAFLAEEKAKEQQRKLTKVAKEQIRLVCNVNSPKTAKEIKRLAIARGLEITNGNGRHGVHLLAPNGQNCPLPVHGGGKELSIGTKRAIMNFINQNSSELKGGEIYV